MNDVTAVQGTPRTISVAAEIIDEYSSVMHETEHMMFGAPESLLPYPKEKIQEAVKVLLNFMNNESLWDTVRTEYPEVTETVLTNRYFNNLKEAYARLAKFVPDTDAELAARANALFDHHAREQIESIRGALSSPWYKKARDLQRKLNDQAMILLVEIEEEYGKKFPGN
jgi:hypothetical protein